MFYFALAIYRSLILFYTVTFWLAGWVELVWSLALLWADIVDLMFGRQLYDIFRVFLLKICSTSPRSSLYQGAWGRTRMTFFCKGGGVLVNERPKG